MGTNQYSITEIAQMCGFEDALYFSRVFKKHYGCAPTKFARKGSKVYPKDPGRMELPEEEGTDK